MTERSGMSRRQALKYGGLAAAVPLLTGMRPAGKAIPVSPQSNWRWCNQCQGLWFAGGGIVNAGRCPAPAEPGGGHNDSGSQNYALTQGSGSGQSNWRWCSQCQGLWFAGHSTSGACPAGGGHTDSGSGNYFLNQGSGSGQSNWRWCSQCQGLWFAGHSTSGACPAGGGHTDSGSGNYFLPQNLTPAQISLAGSYPEYAFTGTGWIPGTIVMVTSDVPDGPIGGPYFCEAHSDGTFVGTIDYSTVIPGAELTVFAVDFTSDQSATGKIQVPI